MFPTLCQLTSTPSKSLAYGRQISRNPTIHGPLPHIPVNRHGTFHDTTPSQMTPEAWTICYHLVNKLVASRKTPQSMGSPTFCGTHKISFLLFKSRKNINTQFLTMHCAFVYTILDGVLLYCYMICNFYEKGLMRLFFW
jgi:hypothetical protein